MPALAEGRHPEQRLHLEELLLPHVEYSLSLLSIAGDDLLASDSEGGSVQVYLLWFPVFQDPFPLVAV
jgi:hypothetical protein